MPDVIVWSKPACVQCHAVKRRLDKLGLSYEERQLQDDLEKLEEFQQQGFMQAPVVESPHHETFTGFRPDYLDVIFEKVTGGLPDPAA